MIRYTLLLFAVVLFSCNHVKNKYPHVLIKTTYGNVEVELYPDKAPKTVTAFLSYVNDGLYTNSSFYRVLTNENVPQENNTGLIQGGIFKTNSSKLAQIPGIPHEPTTQTGLSHTTGTISLARTTPGTASTEFFICIGDQLQFDSGPAAGGDGQGFAAFGKVVDGMDVVRKIQNAPSSGEYFNTGIKINTIEKL